ncbi:hypothetical protein X566_19975 [Afipia sp. P52-10]|uniref:hypothetical protein n=1 Tax=Afipia sp. P52-10 TaxID=1429916 RepID=UPI0003DF1D64|nr:hypothetical protein [Afipia sp. P52-10]ETR75896.1 hypothetical protein X566_19975 [Afipia sp. P52-10]
MYDFEIVKLSPRDTVTPGLMYAKVRLGFAKAVTDDSDVGESVTVEIMVKVPASSTLEDLEQAVLDAVRERLSAASKMIDGRTAKELRASAELVSFRYGQ